jgi:putative sigma-54 modulation protein
MADKGAESVQVKISARHGHLNEATQQFIQDKTQKLLRLFDRLTMIEVTVDLRNEHQTEVEFLARAEHKHEFVARESHADLFAAVDLVMDKLVGQLRRYKEKIQDHRRTPSTGQGSSPPVNEGPADD